MPSGNLTKYTTNHPDMNKLDLIGVPWLQCVKHLPSHQLSGVAEGLNYLHSVMQNYAEAFWQYHNSLGYFRLALGCNTFSFIPMPFP